MLKALRDRELTGKRKFIGTTQQHLGTFYLKSSGPQTILVVNELGIVPEYPYEEMEFWRTYPRGTNWIRRDYKYTEDYVKIDQ